MTSIDPHPLYAVKPKKDITLVFIHNETPSKIYKSVRNTTAGKERGGVREYKLLGKCVDKCVGIYICTRNWVGVHWPQDTQKGIRTHIVQHQYYNTIHDL